MLDRNKFAIPDDLSIPWFLDCRNPEVAAARKAARETVIIVTVPPRSKELAKDRDEEEAKALAAWQKEQKRLKREGSLAKSANRKNDRELAAQGARWDTRTCRWVLDDKPIVKEAAMAKPAAKIEPTPAPTVTTTTVPAESEELQSTFDPQITCRRIPGSKKVMFRGEEMTLSAAALTVAREKGKNWATIRGPLYWMLNGVPLMTRGRK